MTAPAILIILVASFLWLLRYRFSDRFLRAYGLFFLVLVVYASNKEYYGVSRAMYESAASPLSLIRWGLLLLFVVAAWRMKRPAAFHVDSLLGAMVVLLLGYMLVSSAYADSFIYSFMRAVSFALLSFALIKGASASLFSSVNCLHFFRLKYYAAWLTIPPLFLMLITGVNYGVTLIGSQYAGMFGNQNMFGTYSALITPYALFHWRVVARKKWEKAVDLLLLATIFGGLWFSRSRNGLASCVAAIAVYFFVLNVQSRVKSIVAALCIVLAFIFLPALKSDLTSFIRKGTDASTQVTNLSSQLVEEKRYEMWKGVWPLFWKEKLTGYGFASSHLLVFPFTKDEEAGRSMHNSYLEIFGDLGLPGLILLLLILGRVAVMAITLILQRCEYLERNITAVFISVFVAGSANAFLESWMFSVGNLTSLMYWVCVTGVVARWAWRPVEAPEIEPVMSLKARYSYTR
ncbi:MAG: O-antigen ligase family protein [Acidobacteria bacterium]|nr:O-antigen ligase family protein [Acidobacteriota bacterium]